MTHSITLLLWSPEIPFNLAEKFPNFKTNRLSVFKEQLPPQPPPRRNTKEAQEAQEARFKGLACAASRCPLAPLAGARVTRPPAGLLRSAGLRRTQSACTLYTTHTARHATAASGPWHQNNIHRMPHILNVPSWVPLMASANQ